MTPSSIKPGRFYRGTDESVIFVSQILSILGMKVVTYLPQGSAHATIPTTSGFHTVDDVAEWATQELDALEVHRLTA